MLEDLEDPTFWGSIELPVGNGNTAEVAKRAMEKRAFLILDAHLFGETGQLTEALDRLEVELDPVARAKLDADLRNEVTYADVFT